MAAGRLLGSEELFAKFKALGEAVKADTLETAVLAGGTVFLNAAKGNIKDQQLIRTRTLSRSLHQEIKEKTATRVTSEAGTDAPYAAIHEYGGVIRAKKSKYLAIPVGTYKDSPRNHPQLKLSKTAGGTLLLRSPGGTIQYVLRKSVEIPARPYMRPAWDAEQENVSGTIGKAIKKLVEQAAG
jgi:HK97 gp10 family phage protein